MLIKGGFGDNCALLIGKKATSIPVTALTPPTLDQIKNTVNKYLHNYCQLILCFSKKYDTDSGDFHEGRCYLVCRQNLLQLFQQCPSCSESTNGTITHEKASAVHISQLCGNCGFHRKWQNQPYVRNMPVLNLAVSGALLASGCLPTQGLRMLSLLGVASITRSTYFHHQRLYLFPTVFKLWNQRQQEMLKRLQENGRGLCLSGDARCDSPGHSAKFGTYTVIDLPTNKVLHI